jgi:hypothetical protein
MSSFQLNPILFLEINNNEKSRGIIFHLCVFSKIFDLHRKKKIKSMLYYIMQSRFIKKTKIVEMLLIQKIYQVLFFDKKKTTTT